MATTPIYALPSPELGTTADGPAAIGALATRVEREMTTLRGCNQYTAEPNAYYNQNTVNVVFTVNAAVSVIGYLDIAAHVNLSSPDAVLSPSTPGHTQAGSFDIIVDSVVLRTYRWHMLWGTRATTMSSSALVPNSAAQTSRTIQLRLSFGEGPPVFLNHTSLYVCQMGAPGTG